MFISRLRILAILGTVVMGLAAGKAIITFGLAEPWWPISVSGEEEVVIRGTLKKAPPEKTGEINFSLETAAGKEFIDLNRISAESINRIIDQKVAIRGVRREGRLSILDETGKYKVGSFVEVSWAKPDR